MVDIARFRDDLNAMLFSSEYKVELNSVLNNLIGERVVDEIDDSSPRQQM
jgi:hypothetical protein